MNIPGNQLPHSANVALQSVPYSVTLEVAVETAQALGRAEAATLFVVGDDCLVLAVSTLDPSRLVRAAELCGRVLQSGTTVAVTPPLREMWNGQVAAMAIPLVHLESVVGVLYLEGLHEPPEHVDNLMRRCAATIATMLWLARMDVARGFRTACGLVG